MARIKDLWKTKRARPLNGGDSVSFQALRNEAPPASDPSKKQPLLLDNYEAFPKHTKRHVRVSSPALQVLIFLIAMFLFTLVVYLLHCFGPNFVTPGHNYIKAQGADSELLSSLPPPPPPDYNQCKLLKDEEKFDCYPEHGADAAACEARGCCWAKASSIELRVPGCFYPPNYQSYRYVNVTETKFGLTAFLRRSYRSAYGGDVEIIKMIVQFENEKRLHIKFVDPLQSRFEPPYPEVPIFNRPTSNLSYNLELNQDGWGFRIVRKSDNTSIFDSYNLVNMVFSDQFLQISGKLPSSYIYGLGAHRSPLLLSTKWQRLTMFNRDGSPSENTNLYGSHPFYLSIEPSGNTHGVFLLNSNAMDVILQPTPAITFRPIGGVLDLYFFMGPSPGQVISQYTEVIGKPFMPPYWSLGFQLCRFVYKTLNQTKAVMERTIAAGIPLDTQWSAQDYMDKKNMFTYDKVNYRGLPQFVEELHSRGMHYIPLIDPGMSGGEKPGTYFPFDKGVEMDIFVKNSSGQLFIGKVWNSVSTVWPDFTNPNTTDYWMLMMKTFHDVLQFDGAWIDMNEPSDFLSGSFSGCPNSSLETPPYLPAVVGGMLRYKTFCMTARHYAGVHYDVHNLYGLSEAIVTNYVMAVIRRKRPMVLSRASFPGLGHYSGHWSGDIYSTLKDMKYTIPQLLNYNMFGIPLTGADICGFNGDTTVPLCNRWSQLGAFYPFSRNHNAGTIDQDPVALGPLVVASAKKALGVRYALLPYLYTLFWAAHVQGETVARPLFFEFTKDVKTYGIDDQFLWGAALMIIPVLEESSTSVLGYFPAGVWYDYYAKTALESTGGRVNISAPLDTIPVFVRGGHVIPQQSAMQTTTLSRQSKMQLLAASDASGEGHGQLYWDDGDSLRSVEERHYTLLQFALRSGELRSEPVWWGSENPPNLGAVTVLGVNTPVSEVTVNQVAQAFRYDTSRKYLLIENLNVSLENAVVISWK